jgi:hypothetical protein
VQRPRLEERRTGVRALQVQRKRVASRCHRQRTSSIGAQRPHNVPVGALPEQRPQARAQKVLRCEAQRLRLRRAGRALLQPARSKGAARQ